MLIEIYKSLNKASAENFFDSLFELKFRQSQFPLELKMPFCNSVYHDKNSIRYFGPQIWNSVPFEIRNAVTLEDFSRKIKFWKPENVRVGFACIMNEKWVLITYIKSNKKPAYLMLHFINKTTAHCKMRYLSQDCKTHLTRSRKDARNNMP